MTIQLKHVNYIYSPGTTFEKKALKKLQARFSEKDS